MCDNYVDKSTYFFFLRTYFPKLHYLTTDDQMFIERLNGTITYCIEVLDETLNL